jgi:hypothetical protein
MNLAVYYGQSLKTGEKEKGYQPDIRYNYGTFRDVIPVMDVVLRDTMGKTWH